MPDYSAYAIAKRPSGQDKVRFESAGLVVENMQVLIVEAESLGSYVPLPGHVFTWNGTRYTVRGVNPVEPDGTPIIYEIVGSL